MKLFKGDNMYVWWHLLAMVVVFVLVLVGVKYALDFYTHHGEEIVIPDVRHKDVSNARQSLAEVGLVLEVSDTGYVRTSPPDCVLEQFPAAGEKVKVGRLVRVTVNAMNSPAITLPDVIDNSSFREAMARLKAMGFKLGEPQFVSGEQDWVYGILVRGRHVTAGDRISVDDKLVIQVGNGMRDAADDYNMVGSSYEEDFVIDENPGTTDDFEEVTVPESNTTEQN